VQSAGFKNLLRLMPLALEAPGLIFRRKEKIKKSHLQAFLVEHSPYGLFNTVTAFRCVTILRLWMALLLLSL